VGRETPPEGRAPERAGRMAGDPGAALRHLRRSDVPGAPGVGVGTTYARSWRARRRTHASAFVHNASETRCNEPIPGAHALQREEIAMNLTTRSLVAIVVSW